MDRHASPASNTLLPGHYPAWQDPMTNISRHRLRNALSQNHSIRRCGLRYFAAAAPDAAARNSLTQVTCAAPRDLRHAGPATRVPALEPRQRGPAMADTVLYEVSDGLATITLNRPEAMNAMNIETKVALRDAAAGRRRRPRRTGRAADRGRRPGVLRRARTSRSTSGCWPPTGESGSGPTMSTVREHYNPIVRALDRDAEAGGGRRSTASRRAPASASRSPRTTGSSPTPPPSTPRSPGSR